MRYEKAPTSSNGTVLVDLTNISASHLTIGNYPSTHDGASDTGSTTSDYG